MWIIPTAVGILKEAPPGVTLSNASPTLWTRPQEVLNASYPALVAVARPARPVQRCLHPRRLPPLRRLGHGTGPQRRGTHHHPVPHRPGPGGPLEGGGELRRDRPLESGGGRVDPGR